MNVVAIVRGDLKIYIPKSSERIYPQDKLAVVGTDGQLQKFRDEIESPQGVPDTEEMHQEMNLHSFTVNEAFHFLDKSIVQSRLGEKYDSIVVAIERNGALVPLDKDATFLLGDLVWFVGEREKIRQLF